MQKYVYMTFYDPYHGYIKGRTGVMKKLIHFLVYHIFRQNATKTYIKILHCDSLPLPDRENIVNNLYSMCLMHLLPDKFNFAF